MSGSERAFRAMVNGAQDFSAVSASTRKVQIPRRAGDKLLHIITGLNVGGAETMLAKLIENRAHMSVQMEQEVLSLLTPGPLAERLTAAKIPVHTLNMRAGVLTPNALVLLRSVINAISPDLIVGWMHHGFMAAWTGSRMVSPRPPVIWNVRHSISDIRDEKFTTRMILRAAAKVSGSASAIIYNSAVARSQYDAIGFDNRRAAIIANGFDCNQFKPDPSANAWLRPTFGIAPDVPVIGMVARYHPMKNPGNLIKAVAAVRETGKDAHLLIVGKGMDTLPPEVDRLARTLIPENRITLEGVRFDIQQILAGVDLLVSPSAWGEAFPNVLGEAMACGVPCIATDVGDSKAIIGEAGEAVPPRDPEALAQAIGRMLDLSEEERKALGQRGRARVQQHYSIPTIVQQYSDLYESVLGMRDRSAPLTAQGVAT